MYKTSASNETDKLKVEDLMDVGSNVATIANDQKSADAFPNTSEIKLKNASSRSESRERDGPKGMLKQDKSANGGLEKDCGCGCHKDDTGAGHPCSSEAPICLTSCSSHEVKVKVTNLGDVDDHKNELKATPSESEPEDSAKKLLPQQSLPNNKGVGHPCTDKRPSCAAACMSHGELTNRGHPCSNIPCVTTCDSDDLSQNQPSMKGFSRIESKEAVEELGRKNTCDCVCHNEADHFCSSKHPICLSSCSSHEVKGKILNLDDDDQENLSKAAPSEPEGEEDSAAKALHEQSYYDMLQFTKNLTKAEPEPEPELKLAEQQDEPLVLPRMKSRDDCSCACHFSRSKGVGHPCTDKHPACATECSSHEEIAKFGHPCSKSIKRIPCVTYCDSVELTRSRSSKAEMSKQIDSTASPTHQRESLLKRMSKAFRKSKELDEKK